MCVIVLCLLTGVDYTIRHGIFGGNLPIKYYSCNRDTLIQHVASQSYSSNFFFIYQLTDTLFLCNLLLGHNGPAQLAHWPISLTAGGADQTRDAWKIHVIRRPPVLEALGYQLTDTDVLYI